MNREYLLLPIWAPMQSWGDLSLAGDDKPSLSFPTFSGICGLIGAALGIDRTNSDRLNEIQNGLDFIVMELSQGQMRTDFYSVQGLVRAEGLVAKPKDTFIGRKKYLADASFIVALFIRESCNLTLQQIGEALIHPKFQLYAGRKSYPFSLPPIYHRSGEPIIFNWSEPLESLLEIKSGESKWQSNLIPNKTEFSEEMNAAVFKNRKLPEISRNTVFYFGQQTALEIESVEPGKGIPQKIWDHDMPGSGKIRQFEQRKVYRHVIGD